MRCPCSVAARRRITDIRIEGVKSLAGPFSQKADLRPIPSIWGHRAGNSVLNPEDTAFIDRAVFELLAR
jgi:hypothetical protein